MTERHSRDQHALSSRVIARTLQLWPLLDMTRLDATFTAWARVMIDMVRALRGESSALATRYYDLYRHAETGLGGFDVPAAPYVDENRLFASLIVTGPSTVKRLAARGATPREASLRARTDVASAAVRHVANGGRDTIKAAVQADVTALGFARVTDGDPCWFCAMLAGRGAVYKDSATALLTESGDKYHDGCGCTVAAIYEKDAPLPGIGDELSRLWVDYTRGKKGVDARKAFRHAWESREK